MHVAVSHDISYTFFMNTDSSSMSLFSFQVFAGSSKTISCLMMNETPNTVRHIALEQEYKKTKTSALVWVFPPKCSKLTKQVQHEKH